jgi:hypothetical protein
MKKRFKEKLNTAVLTTKYVIEQNSPILYVYHYNDGTWQFNGKEKNLKDEDYRVISLDEVLTIDSSLNELAELSQGFEGVRETKDSEWKIISAN